MISSPPPSRAARVPDGRHGPLGDRLIITIDGPAGTGKSSVARELAGRLGLAFLDTGAMYRAAAAIAIDQHLMDADGRADAQRLIDAVVRSDLRFDWTTDPPTLLVSGKSVMGRIRDADVTAVVSPIASLSSLRRYMVQQQQQIAAAHPRLVSEGRDQGSVVFPDADVKFYLDASPRVRAERRAEQLRHMGQAVNVDDLEREIAERDRSDSSRVDGPLIFPEGAKRVDTSDLARAAVVDTLEAIVRTHVAVRTVGE